jgi:nicotinate-nucleotide pyrophosphorylase (carboxylating)
MLETRIMTTIASLLHPEAFLSPLAIDEAVQRALNEDLGRAGDITSMATIPEATHAHAILVARQSGVIAGLPLAVAVFQKLSPDISIQAHFRDGGVVAAGVQVLTISGPARAVLTGERTALNFVGRLSGIATLTADYVRHTAGTKMRICCTRKTTPGLRALEKYAIRCGGGFNHRFGLDSGVLIKENHIAAAGSIGRALERARKRVPHTMRVEIECETPAQVEEALAAGADSILLDNMTLDDMRRARVLAPAGRVLLEVSGGVTLDGVRAIAETGVDLISVGALTHSAPAVDLSMRIDPI